MRASSDYRLLAWTARMSGLVSMVVLATLVAGFVGQRTTLPSDDAELLSMRQQLSADPQQPELRRRIRDISAQRQDDYFSWQRWSRCGAIVLACGLVVTTVLWQWILARCSGERPARLTAAMTTEDSSETRAQTRAQLACIGVLLLLIFASGIWILVSSRVRFDATIRPDTSNIDCVRIDLTRLAESAIWHTPEVS